MNHHQICFFSHIPTGMAPAAGWDMCVLSGYKRNGWLSEMRKFVVGWGGVVVPHNPNKKY
jgi:hypothetical protein